MRRAPGPPRARSSPRCRASSGATRSNRFSERPAASPEALEGAGVRMLVALFTALVEPWRLGLDGVADRGTALLQGQGLGGSAIVRELAELWVDPDQIGSAKAGASRGRG